MSKSRILPWWMWTLTVAFFAYQFVLRVSPGVMMQDIITKFHIDASTFGWLTAFYYLGYAGMQIPVGMLLDRYNPRYIIGACIILCSLGMVSFIYADHWLIALLGRFSIGAGSAAGFLGTCKILRAWFRNDQYAYMVGFTVTIGLVGAVGGGFPVSVASQKWGGHATLLGLTIIGFVLALMVIIFLYIPKIKEEQEEQEEKQSITAQITGLFKEPTILFMGLSSGLMVGVLGGFSDVWGVPYLMADYGFSKDNAAFLNSLIYVGLAIGGPLLAFISEKYKCSIGLTLFSGLGMAVTVLLLLGGFASSEFVCGALLLIAGILCGYQVLILTLVSRMVHSNAVGLTTALANCLNVVFGFVFLASIGLIMDYFWLGELENGLRVYDVKAYKMALSTVPIASILGAVWFWTMKRKINTTILLHEAEA